MAEQLYQYIPNYGATVVLLIFMGLWHKRTMERDRQFHETLQSIVDALMDCIQSRTRE